MSVIADNAFSSQVFRVCSCLQAIHDSVCEALLLTFLPRFADRNGRQSSSAHRHSDPFFTHSWGDASATPRPLPLPGSPTRSQGPESKPSACLGSPFSLLLAVHCSGHLLATQGCMMPEDWTGFPGFLDADPPLTLQSSLICPGHPCVCSYSGCDRLEPETWNRQLRRIRSLPNSGPDSSVNQSPAPSHPPTSQAGCSLTLRSLDGQHFLSSARVPLVMLFRKRKAAFIFWLVKFICANRPIRHAATRGMLLCRAGLLAVGLHRWLMVQVKGCALHSHNDPLHRAFSAVESISLCTGAALIVCLWVKPPPPTLRSLLRCTRLEERRLDLFDLGLITLWQNLTNIS